MRRAARGSLDLLDDIRNAAGCGGPPPTLALKDMPFLMKPDLMPFLRDYLEHPAFGAYWQEFELGHRLGQISMPCLHLSGWYDTFVNQTLNAYRRFTSETRRRSPPSDRTLVSYSLDPTGRCC